MMDDYERPDSASPARDAADEPRLETGEPAHEPAINAPWIIIALIASFVAVQLLRGFISQSSDYHLLLDLAFLPLRYSMPPELANTQLPGGIWPAIFSPFTHFFLHAGWMHLTVNSLWLLAFGAPVARRLGPWRFLMLTLLSAAGGAVFYLIFHWGEPALLVGASGGVSGLMGAAIRLIFAGNMSLTEGMRRDLSHVRPLTVMQSFLYARPRMFILIWMGINLVFGLTGMGASGQMGSIAWEAHTGGFLTGLFAFGFLDRNGKTRRDGLEKRGS